MRNKMMTMKKKKKKKTRARRRKKQGNILGKGKDTGEESRRKTELNPRAMKSRL